MRQEFTDPERRTAYYMVVPTIVIILLIAFYPVAASFYHSLRLDVPGGEPGT